MLPCQRKTSSQVRKSRAHQALRPVQSVRCPNCGERKLPHAACRGCGYVRPGLQLNLSKED